MDEKNNEDDKSSVPVSETSSENTPEPTSEAPTDNSTSDVKKSSNTNIIIGAVVAIALLFGGYMYLQSSKSSDNQNGGSVDSSEEIIADAVVARVNGVDLFGIKLSLQIIQAAQASGLPDVDSAPPEIQAQLKSQSLDAIINTELLIQVAKDAGMTASDEDIEAEFASISESIGGEEVANQRLAEMGVTLETFKENLAGDILIGRYLESVTDESELIVTEEEIKVFYDQVSAGQTDGIPPLEEVRSQIEEQLKFQKQQEFIGTLIETLRADADIEILI